MAGSKTVVTPVQVQSNTSKPIKNSTPKMPMTPTQPEPYKTGSLLGKRGKPTILGPTAPGAKQ